ncbi:hypothetical protein AC628_12585 [Bradyrhizobium sp. NAS96.2]|nr:hypothetical protein AC628_12585 [Bradyrhizobium sp. NAS96.2]
MLSLADKDPFPTYDLLRKRGQVVWDPGMNCWLVLSYNICKVIESDEKTYRILAEDASPFVYEIKGGRTAATSLVGEEHARMRRLYLKLLSPTLMSQYRVEHVLPVINYIIDGFAEKGSAELVTQLADRVPNLVMGSLFGLPWKDDALMDQVSEWHKDLTVWFGMKYLGEEVNRKARVAANELNKVFLPLILERREKRGNDFISQIWSRAPEDWGEVDVDDVVTIVRDLEIGAGDTTANAIANAVYLFLSDPAMHEAVSKDQQGALNAFVEETLRLFGAVQWRFRRADRDVPLAGAEVRKGDTICLLHAASNRDPEHYACPHMIDLNRKLPTDHLAFNVGPRICVGMHLARLLMRECVKVLIARLPNLHLDPAKEAPHFRAFSHRSFGPLHVLF